MSPVKFSGATPASLARAVLAPSVQSNPRGDLLARLRSAGNYKYSRYNGLPLRYAGGKSLAVGHVIERIPSSVKRLASPFFGGGAVEIACVRELGMEVVGYDLFDILANYWQVQLRAPKRLAERIAQWRPEKAIYGKVKARLGKHWRKEKKIDDKLELAAHYWFNHNLSYGPGFLGWMSKIYEDSSRFERLVHKVRDFKCPGLKVKQASFEKILPKHRKDFLYCDPPYYLDGNSKMFKGIYPQRNFPVHHNAFDHAELHRMLKLHKGGFILSYNDCKWVRDHYSDCKIEKVTWQYTLGQGETRIGKNRLENGSKHHVKHSHELVITR